MFHMPDVPLNWATLQIVFPYALILATIGLTESLLTLNLIDEMTDTRGKPNRECLAQGAANVVTGLFGGMGGCAMIGQSMINVNNGATHRLSGIAMALFLLSFILFGSSLIERIPLAALIGVMFVVSEKTFEWGSLQVLGKMPRSDAIIVVAVTDSDRLHRSCHRGGARRGDCRAGVRLAARQADRRDDLYRRQGLEGLRTGRLAVLRLDRRLPVFVHARSTTRMKWWSNSAAPR